jgi:hypothetical protein
LLAGEGEALIRNAVELALAGDPAALRIASARSNSREGLEIARMA